VGSRRLGPIGPSPARPPTREHRHRRRPVDGQRGRPGFDGRLSGDDARLPGGRSDHGGPGVLLLPEV